MADDSNIVRDHETEEELVRMDDATSSADGQLPASIAAALESTSAEDCGLVAGVLDFDDFIESRAVRAWRRRFLPASINIGFGDDYIIILRSLQILPAAIREQVHELSISEQCMTASSPGERDHMTPHLITMGHLVLEELPMLSSITLCVPSEPLRPQSVSSHAYRLHIDWTLHHACIEALKAGRMLTEVRFRYSEKMNALESDVYDFRDSPRLLELLIGQHAFSQLGGSKHFVCTQHVPRRRILPETFSNHYDHARTPALKSSMEADAVLASGLALVIDQPRRHEHAESTIVLVRRQEEFWTKAACERQIKAAVDWWLDRCPYCTIQRPRRQADHHHDDCPGRDRHSFAEEAIKNITILCSCPSCYALTDERPLICETGQTIRRVLACAFGSNFYDYWMLFFDQAGLRDGDEYVAYMNPRDHAQKIDDVAAWIALPMLTKPDTAMTNVARIFLLLTRTSQRLVIGRNQE